MSFLRRAWLPVFALISSCGKGPAVSEETPVVALEPQTKPSVQAFVVWDTSDGTLVYDGEHDASFTIAGHPLHDDRVWGAPDAWMEVGFLADDLRLRWVTSADGSLLLLRRDAEIVMVDLREHGAVRGTFHGHADHAAIAPDGGTFVTNTANAMNVVDVASGTVTTVASTLSGGPPALTWRDGLLLWVDDGVGAHLFDLETHHDVAVDLPGARLTSTRDRIVLWNESAVQVWRPHAKKPETVTRSAHVANVIADETGARVAWLEYDGERSQLHTLDVAANVHLRFPSRAEPCSLSPERLVSIEDALLVTDEECTTGCPSFESHPSLVAYDFASGAFTRRWSGPVSPPYNEGLNARFTEAERIANLFGLSRESAGEIPLRHHPREDLVLVRGEHGLRLAAVSDGSTTTELDESSEFTASEVTFSKDEAVLVGTGKAGLAVWDMTGRRLFHAVVSAQF